MLSPAFLSPRITISHPPSLFSIQSSKSRKNFKSKNESRYHSKTTHNLPCLCSENTYSTSNFENTLEFSTSQENSDAEFFDKESTSGCPSPELLALWLRSCCSVNEVRRIHVLFLKCFTISVTYVGNNLISSYLRFGKLVEARKVFDGMPDRNVVTWTAIINGYLSFGLDDEALRLFSDSIRNKIQGNGKMFVCILNLCSKRLEFDLGVQIHACVVKGNWRNLIVDSAVVNFYAQCGDLASAFVAFHQMPKHDVVCWTSIITACSQQGCGQEVFLMYSKMLKGRFLPNEFTVCGVLKACGEEKELRYGRQLHSTIIKKIVKNDVFVGSSLVDMYAKCGEITDSRKVFDGMRNRNTVTWTSIIAGYAREGHGEEAISLFRMMKRWKVFANNLTIVSVLKACGSIGASLLGREVHAQMVKSSIQTNMHIGSTLVWFYCKCGDYPNASLVLQQMPFRDVVSWTTIISGCAHLGHEFEALEFLKEMVEEGVEPNSYTYSSALKACAKLQAVLQGKLIHSTANKNPALSNVFVGSALIYMYAKCGYVAEASQVFGSMPVRNLVSWKAMILGYARNGHCREALKLMYRMQAEGFEVDDYILATVYSVCGDVACDSEPTFQYSLQSS